MDAADDSSVVARLAALVVLLTVAGCGTATAPADTPRRTGGDEPTTAAALAWVAAERVGRPDSARDERDIAGELGAGSVGTELRYGADGEYDGDLLVVAVGTKTPDELTCTAESRAGGGCVETERGTLLWEAQAPEEDPGNVGVGVTKGGTTVLVFQSGPVISGDPRDLHLRVSVADMFALAGDPRVDVTTSKAAVAAGSDLPYWRD